MASTYVNNLRLEEQATGENSGAWGTKLNAALEQIGQALGIGSETIGNADATITVADGANDDARALYIKIASSTNLTATRTITMGPNTMKRIYIIENATGGAQSIIIKQGSGATVTVANSAVKIIQLDGAGSGAAVIDAFVDLDLTGTTTAAALNVSGNIDVDGTTNLDVVDIDGAVDMASTLQVAGAVVFNEGSADVDFRVEGNARANLLVVDGGKDMIGVGMQPDQSWGSNSVGINFGIADGDAGAITWQEISGADSFNFSWNAYNDNTNWKYSSGNPSSRYYQLNGEHVFTSAVAGNADANITFLENLSLSSGASVFNDGSVDMDFRVESNGNANMLFVDGGNNRVGVGTGTLNREFTVSKADQCDVAITAANDQSAQLCFGDPEDDNIGVIGYNNADNSMRFTVNAAERFRIDSVGDAKLSGAGTEVYMDIFSDSGSDRGAGYFRFRTDGSSADEAVAQIYMEQGSGDGGSRKCNMYFQVSDNGAPSTAMTIANNKEITTAGNLIVTGTVTQSSAKTKVFQGQYDGSTTGTTTLDSLGFKPMALWCFMLVNSNTMASWGFAERQGGTAMLFDNTAHSTDHTYGSGSSLFGQLRFGSSNDVNLSVSSWEDNSVVITRSKDNSGSSATVVYKILVMG